MPNSLLIETDEMAVVKKNGVSVHYDLSLNKAYKFVKKTTKSCADRGGPPRSLHKLSATRRQNQGSFPVFFRP